MSLEFLRWNNIDTILVAAQLCQRFFEKDLDDDRQNIDYGIEYVVFENLDDDPDTDPGELENLI